MPDMPGVVPVLPPRAPVVSWRSSTQLFVVSEERRLAVVSGSAHVSDCHCCIVSVSSVAVSPSTTRTRGESPAGQGAAPHPGGLTGSAACDRDGKAITAPVLESEQYATISCLAASLDVLWGRLRLGFGGRTRRLLRQPHSVIVSGGS
jgi:hypothetical protein